MKIIITRMFTYMNPRRNNLFQSAFAKQIIEIKKGKKKFLQHGNLSSVRTFLDTEDACNAYWLTAKKGIIGEIYNIGCDEGMEYSILDVAKLLIKSIQKTEDYDKWITYIEDRPFNDQRYYISNQKLKDLGWNITIDFMDGLENLVNS